MPAGALHPSSKMFMLEERDIKEKKEKEKKEKGK